MKLQNKVALITGGGTGIGLGIAGAMAEEGAALVLAGRRPGPLEEAAAGLRARGARVAIATGDVAVEEDARRMVAAAVAEFGRLDVLVNNAGVVGWHGPLSEMPVEEFDRVTSTNLRGTFLCSRFAVLAMAPQGGGSIINISSVCGLKAWKGLAAYGATKAGINLMTRAMAADHAHQQIRVNAICPGTVDVNPDPLVEPGSPRAQQLERLAKLYPIGRVGRPDDIAPLAVMLASAESTWITGSIFTVDGGLTA